MWWEEANAHALKAVHEILKKNVGLFLFCLTLVPFHFSNIDTFYLPRTSRPVLHFSFGFRSSLFGISQLSCTGGFFTCNQTWQGWVRLPVRSYRRLGKTVLAAWPASCSILMGWCKDMVNAPCCHWLTTSAAFTAKVAAWSTAQADHSLRSERSTRRGINAAAGPALAGAGPNARPRRGPLWAVIL